MLEIEIPSSEYFDDSNQIFVNVEPTILHLEHSLLSVSKWEEKWEVPFLSNKEMTFEQSIDYVQCMSLGDKVPSIVYRSLTAENFSQIEAYMNKKATATWFNDSKKVPKSREIITSEIIYYWMITLGIPKEFEKWHLNRLLTLIKVCNIKNSPPKKMTKSEIMQRNKAINAARKKRLGTSG